jgi:hypothetical protein
MACNMKNHLYILLLLLAFVSQAQRSMFVGNNNYVAPVAPPAIITNNLVLYLNANTYSGLGAIWSDASTQNNHATLIGSPVYSSNPASFTLGQNIYASTAKTNYAFSSVTFIAWVNPSQTQGTYTGIIFNRNGNGGSSVPATGLDLYSNNSVGYHWSDNYYNWDSNLYVPNDAWSMIAITISSTKAVAYLCNSSGIFSATNTVSHASLSGLNFFIGCDPLDKISRTFKGKISTAMIYSGALAQADITSTFNAQKAAFGL